MFGVFMGDNARRESRFSCPAREQTMGPFVAALGFSLQSRGDPQNPGRQAVCVSLPAEARRATPLAGYCSWESVIGSGNVS